MIKHIYDIRIFSGFLNLSVKVLNFSTKKFLFNESDIEEKFVHGWGPGGQKINKTANCVFLKHIPTGIIVKCQDSRELHRNRDIARSWLNDKLDVHLNGDNSDVVKRQNQVKDRKYKMHIRSKERLALKLAFKERESFRSNANDENDV